MAELATQSRSRPAPGSQAEVIHEAHRPREESAVRRLRKKFFRSFWTFWTNLQLASVLGLILFICLLFIDLPMRLFDGVTSQTPVLTASNWLSQGEAWMPLSLLYLLLVTRRQGVQGANRVIYIGWTIMAVLVGLLLFYMAPQLGAADYPDARFAAGFAASWFIGHLVAVGIYDITRGGKWWRAPLYGALFGFAAQVAVYFPAIYYGSEAPWLNWMVTDYSFKAVMAALFLAVYWPLRRPLRPYLGDGVYAD